MIHIFFATYSLIKKFKLATNSPQAQTDQEREWRISADYGAPALFRRLDTAPELRGTVKETDVCDMTTAVLDGAAFQEQVSAILKHLEFDGKNPCFQRNFKIKGHIEINCNNVHYHVQ